MSVSSEVCFLMGLGVKMVPGSVVGCVENIANTVVFVRFHFFTYLVNWLISNRLLEVFLVGLGELRSRELFCDIVTCFLDI